MGIRFNGTEEGHAINAFETTDKGLVYIDCTNGRYFGDDDDATQSWDTIAYVETGRKYGILHIDRVISAPYSFYALEYDFYADCEKDWQDYKNLLDSYNKEVDKYNKEISGRVYIIGTPEEQKVSAWKEELTQKEQTLDRLEKELGSHWYESEFSSYAVEDVQVHW